MKTVRSMGMRELLLLAVFLPLGACAGVMGSNPQLYQALSDDDVKLASRTLQTALERTPDGGTRRWINKETDDSGAITPIRTYVSDSGYFCREYREELAVGAQSGSFHHTACRDEQGRWVWL
jgi:surface antigen